MYTAAKLLMKGVIVQNLKKKRKYYARKTLHCNTSLFFGEHVAPPITKTHNEHKN